MHLFPTPAYDRHDKKRGQGQPTSRLRRTPPREENLKPVVSSPPSPGRSAPCGEGWPRSGRGGFVLFCHSPAGVTKIQLPRHPPAGRSPLYSTKTKEIRTQWIPAYAGMTNFFSHCIVPLLPTIGVTKKGQGVKFPSYGGVVCIRHHGGGIYSSPHTGAGATHLPAAPYSSQGGELKTGGKFPSVAGAFRPLRGGVPAKRTGWVCSLLSFPRRRDKGFILASPRRRSGSTAFHQSQRNTNAMDTGLRRYDGKGRYDGKSDKGGVKKSPKRGFLFLFHIHTV